MCSHHTYCTLYSHIYSLNPAPEQKKIENIMYIFFSKHSIECTPMHSNQCIVSSVCFVHIWRYLSCHNYTHLWWIDNFIEIVESRYSEEDRKRRKSRFLFFIADQKMQYWKCNVGIGLSMERSRSLFQIIEMRKKNRNYVYKVNVIVG